MLYVSRKTYKHPSLSCSLHINDVYMHYTSQTIIRLFIIVLRTVTFYAFRFAFTQLQANQHFKGFFLFFHIRKKQSKEFLAG